MDKRCARCGEFKPAAEFPRANHKKGGLHAYCRECVAIRNRARRQSTSAAILQSEARRGQLRPYGLTPADYDRMLAEQGGVCGLCGTDRPGPPGRSFAVDHDHASGAVRGLLCFGCNVKVGVLERYINDPELWERVGAWLGMTDQRSIRPLFMLPPAR